MVQRRRRAHQQAQADALHAVVLGHNAIAAWRVRVAHAHHKRASQARGNALQRRLQLARALQAWRVGVQTQRGARDLGRLAIEAIAGKLAGWIAAAAVREWQVRQGEGLLD